MSRGITLLHKHFHYCCYPLVILLALCYLVLAPNRTPQMIQKRGNAYLVRLYRGRDPLTGKKRYLFETLPTKKEAQRWERERKVALDHGTYVEPSKQPFGDFLTAWLDGPARLTVRERTLSGY